MINLKKMILIAVTLLIIGGVGSLITFFTMDRNDIQQSTIVDAANITAMEVRLKNGIIQMQKSDDANIHVELTGQEGNKSNVQLLVEEADGTLLIEVVKTKRTIFDIFSGVHDLRMTVYIPDKVLDSLLATASNTQIIMEDINAEYMNVESNNGSITMFTEDLDRNIDFETNNGDIKIETGKEPTNLLFDVRAKNGNINLFGNDNWNTAIGNGDHLVKLRTNNGDIAIENVADN